ncbi:MAG: DNA repair protein RecO [Planctomycetes bacterium]|nr:DNA repair protein RecO [Planctomycetota bacterium]
MFRDEALVLRRHDWSESSQIANLLTREHGKRSVLAKGSRRERLKGQGPRGIDLLSRLWVTIYPKRGDALDLLGDWEPLDVATRIRASLETLLPALYLAELADALTPLADPAPEVYDGLAWSLAALGGGGGGASPVRPRDSTGPFFSGLSRILASLGYFHPRAGCAACGRSFAGHGPLRFAPASGGILCRDCKEDEPRTVPLSAGAGAVLAALAAGNVDPLRVRVSRAQAAELWRALSRFVWEVAEKRLRAEGAVDRLLAPRQAPARAGAAR